MPAKASGVDAALEELYGAPPAEFTSRRDALAKELKAAGDTAGAAEVKARKKPTQIAYVLNQIARAHAHDVAELVDVGRELARAQRKALRGETGHDLRDAITRQRSVVSELTAKASATMRDLGIDPAGHLDEIAGALQAALVDPAVGARLEEGRLEKVPEVAAGFPGALGPAVEAHDGAPAAAEAKPKTKTKTKERAGSAAHSRAETARAAREEARRERAAAAGRKEEARRAEAAAEAKVAAKAAVAEAAARARAADEAEREADGHAAQAKKSEDEARALAAEAKQLSADAKRVASEASAARRRAQRVEREAARAAVAAKQARAVADRAAKQARAAQARA